MKRHKSLHGLSSDHHRALLLSRDGRGAAERGEAALFAPRLRREFDEELEPHVRIEEEVLLPALELAGAAELARRTREEHRALRALALEAGRGDAAALAQLSNALAAHVRFEEDVLFAACEERLPESLLAEVERRAPKPN